MGGVVIRWIFLQVLRVVGGVKAFDSCGPEEGELCRHGMSKPDWMEGEDE